MLIEKTTWPDMVLWLHRALYLFSVGMPGGLKLDTSTFVAMTARLCELADTHCEGRIVSLLEGIRSAQ